MQQRLIHADSSNTLEKKPISPWCIPVLTYDTGVYYPLIREILVLKACLIGTIVTPNSSLGLITVSYLHLAIHHDW